MIAHSLATSSCLVAASARTVCATWAGEFDLPRFGAGVRNGASVSARISPAGMTAAASRSCGALANVTAREAEHVARLRAPLGQLRVP